MSLPRASPLGLESNFATGRWVDGSGSLLAAVRARGIFVAPPGWMSVVPRIGTVETGVIVRNDFAPLLSPETPCHGPSFPRIRIGRARTRRRIRLPPTWIPPGDCSNHPGHRCLRRQSLYGRPFNCQAEHLTSRDDKSSFRRSQPSRSH